MNKENTFKLNIITPERVFFNGYVEQVVVDTINGSLGILKEMAPEIIAMVTGQMSILKDGVWSVMSNGRGFIEVKNENVQMFVETVEWPEEIDSEEVQKTIKINEELMRRKKSYHEYLYGKANIARAMARLKVKGTK